ncbi:MAG: glucose-6-phosphate isomerase [Clostridiales bacterium]|nr:glucose-6-phosphate isomerase [Clostridiales bacterium]
MMVDCIGSRGLDKVQFPALAYQTVIEGLGKGWQEWSELPSEAQLDEIIAFCDPIRKKAQSVVVLGIGGSALGAAAVANALLHLRHNELPEVKRNAPKFYVEDNIDPERMQALLDVIDLNRSYFIVITKSGETSETLSQFLIAYDALKNLLGDKAREHIVAVTTIGKGTLYDIAVSEGFKIFGVGKGVGGRFSVLSPVGLVPLACVGIDIKGLIAGAKKAAQYCTDSDLNVNIALMMAVLNIEAYKKGCNISVMMPYADSLKYMSDFYAQLWGESLGKKEALSGEIVHVGQTPVKALGVTDQHSQIQLYTEGPFDKVVTFLSVKCFRTKCEIPDDKKEGLSFLKGHTLNELIDAECKATAFALKKAERPNMTLTLDSVTPQSVGELIMIFMYQTAFAGAMLGVDTYNQPGVEEGKKATFAMMGRIGYEDKYKEMTAVSGQYTIERD